MNSNAFTPQFLNRLRMRQVALLLSIEELGTLRGAANALGMTQPAATKMLHELEDALGHTLFDRVGRGLKLTPSGTAVLATFQGMRGTMEALGRELAELRLGSAGKLFVGTIAAAAPALLTDSLIQLKQKFPLLSVEISTGTSDRLMDRLREGALDVVIGRLQSMSTQDYIFRPLEDEALAVVAAKEHPLANRKAKTLQFAHLLEYPWILQPSGSSMREAMEQEFKSHHVPLPKGLIETSSILITTNLIAKTQTVAVIPYSVASRYEQQGLLRILPYTVRQKLSAYGSIVRQCRPLSVAATQFLQLLHSGENHKFNHPQRAISPADIP